MLTWLVHGLPALAALLACGAPGVAVLRRPRLGLTRLEAVAYGLPAGIVAVSLLLLGLAIVVGRLSAALVLAVALGSLVLAIVLWPRECRIRSRRLRWRGAIRAWRPRIDRLPVLLFALVALEQAWLWSRLLRYDGGELVATQPNIWGDWGMHLGDLAAFLWGDDFPPAHARLAGAPMAYHYLASFTAAGLATLGPDPVQAMTTQSWLLVLCIVAGLYAFGRRVAGQRPAALLFVALGLLGGGYGYLPLLARLRFSPADPLAVFDQRVFDRQFLRDTGYPLPNLKYLIQAQRGYLYGLPLALLSLTLLLIAVRRVHARFRCPPAAEEIGVDPDRRWHDLALRAEAPRFAAAGVAAGLLPLAHLSTLLALILALPAVALLSLLGRPLWAGERLRRVVGPLVFGWAVFGAVWVALTVPQVLWIYGGRLGGTAALRVQLGWLAGPEPGWWFWLKNLGTFALLVPVAVVSRGLLDGVARRFLLGFGAIFVLCNIFAFLPWDWNNALFLAYWLLSAALLVAALLGRAWARRREDPLAHLALSVVLLSLIGLGLLVHLNHATAEDRLVLLDREGLALSARVRAETPPDALFVTGTQYTNPIAILTGRRLVVGFTTWLWTQGLDYAAQERDARAILRFAPQAPALLAKYRVDYVVIGPWEVEQLGANDAAFRERYPVAIATDRWTVFAISPRAIARLPHYAAVEAEGPGPRAALVPVSPAQRRGAIPAIAWRDLPTGPRPDAAAIAEIEAAFARMNSVNVPAEQAALDACYSADFGRRAWVIWTRRYGAWDWQPKSRGAPADVRQLPDGRIGVLFRDPAPEAGIFVVMVEQNGRWLVDEYLQVSPDGAESPG